MTDIFVTLTRAFQNNDVTLGILQVKDEDHPPIYILENPWLDNAKYKSCIPKDCYVVNPRISQKYGKCWELQGVPDRSAILIHAGNTAGDTMGCLLPGLGAGELHGQPAVLHSRMAMRLLELLIGRNSFIITIK